MRNSHIVAIVRGIVRSLKPRLVELNQRVDEIETRQPKAGPSGPRGERGEVGEHGPVGPEGRRGQSAYEVASDFGFSGTPIDWLRTLIGPTGPEGPRGPAGPPGEVGGKGDKGDPGDPGTGGRDGKDGRDGRDGKDGAPGRDAAELEVLVSIDGERSYPRGTFASADGGLMRAVRDTDPIGETCRFSEAGWQVLVRGVSDVVIEQIDERQFGVRIRMTGEVRHSRQTAFTMPVMIYRGTYKKESGYLPGDVVTSSGSAWHCHQPTSKCPPGEDWKQMVMRGRPGKDARGESGTNGPVTLDPKA